MEPLISIQVLHGGRPFAPQEVLACQYQIDGIDPAEIAALEASVMWYTEGKGDEDLAVHYFERRTPSDVVDGDLRTLRRFECQLPKAPLSYTGLLFKIRWCVRVRIFLKGGRDLFADERFLLGDVPAAEIPPAPPVDAPPPAETH
jgi:hypothetical protein